jgi:Peptidase family S41/N-terminal domain of Peptidase_S41 in eukaryotic IRBP
MNRQVALTLVLLLLPAATTAQGATPSPSGWNAATRAQALARAEKALANYYFADRVAGLRAVIETNREALLQINDPKQFAEVLTSDLQEASHDKHIIVWYSKTADENQSRNPTAAEMARMNRFFQYVAYGYDVSARLQGNIGYLRLGGFADMPIFKGAIDAAMTLVGHTDALIVDLQNNGGGDADAVKYLLGYFFLRPTEVSGAIQREHGTTVSFHEFTPAKVGGPRYVNRPVYVLIGPRTISGGEMCAYDLKTLRRALLIGQTTAGAANILGSPPYFLSAHLSISVPDGAIRNPYTGTNWEGVGVTPDVVTEPKAALLTAYERALATVNGSYDPLGELAQARKDPAAALRASLPEI